MTGAEGIVVSETRYAPFGEVRWQAGSPVTDFTFTGQRDDGFGLMDYNARFCSMLYDAERLEGHSHGLRGSQSKSGGATIDLNIPGIPIKKIHLPKENLMELSELQKHLLGYSANDDMGLWVVIWEITKNYTIKEPQEITRRKAIMVIREMLQNGWIVIGKPINHDNEVVFQLFPISVDEAIDYIENKWNELGRFPNLGEICWFTATPAGIQLANELGLEG